MKKVNVFSLANPFSNYFPSRQRGPFGRVIEVHFVKWNGMVHAAVVGFFFLAVVILIKIYLIPFVLLLM